MFEIDKHVDEEFPIGLTYSSPDLVSGETIDSVVVSSSPAGLTLSGSPTIVDNQVSEDISGGTVGAEYIVEFKSTISDGNIWVDQIKVKMNRP